MKIFRRISIVLTLTFASASASSQESGKWIVMGRDAASRTQAFFRVKPLLEHGQPAFTMFESNEDRIIARASDAAMNQLSRTIHTDFHRCGGYTVHDSREAALAEVNNPFYAEEFKRRKLPFTMTIDQQIHVMPALNLISKSEIIDTISALASLGTRYYESEKGQDAAVMLEKRWQTYGASRNDFSVTRFIHGWKQNSVIATIKGSERPEEIVIIGAHLDSINLNDNSNAPGADDDASGVAVVSEVLRVLATLDFKPKRTLQFMAYAAEEVGLRGSGEIANLYKKEGKKVLSVLQIDMTGFAGSAKNMYFVDDYVNKDLTDFLKRLIGEYNGPGDHEITHEDTRCGYACSDHGSWTRVGVPSSFPFEAAFDDSNKAIHSPMDVVANMDATGGHQARFAKLGIEFMIEVGKRAN